MKRKIYYGASACLFLCAPLSAAAETLTEETVIAETVSSVSENALHQFEPGTKAKASEVNENFASLLEWIEKHAEVINSHAQAINLNADAIDRNNTDIAGNAQAIAELDRRVEANNTRINVNAGQIAHNAAAINQNGQDIAENKTDITDLDHRVKANKTELDDHAGQLDKNTGQISANKDNIKSNTDSIAENKADITAASESLEGQALKITENTQALAVLKEALNQLQSKANLTASVDTAACTTDLVQCGIGEDTLTAASNLNHNPIAMTVLVEHKGAPVTGLSLTDFEFHNPFVPAGAGAAVICSEANCGRDRFKASDQGLYVIWLDQSSAGNWTAGRYSAGLGVKFTDDEGVAHQEIILVTFEIPQSQPFMVY